MGRFTHANLCPAPAGTGSCYDDRMRSRVISFVSLAAAFLGPIRLPAALPLQDGERLTYRVSWAIVPGAGEIKISAKQDVSGPAPRMIVTTNTRTRGLARMLLKFDAESQSVFDLKS